MHNHLLNPSDVAAEAVRRGADPYFRGRIREMALHGSITHGSVNGDSLRSYYTGMRVAKGWPSRGSITLYRQDGATVRLGMGKRRFTVKVEKGKG